MIEAWEEVRDAGWIKQLRGEENPAEVAVRDVHFIIDLLHCCLVVQFIERCNAIHLFPVAILGCDPSGDIVCIIDLVSIACCHLIR